ncbi:alkaline phosphatase family protein [Alteromonas sp. a30]|uniref:alkaline phosphatase family protein n=1 Tax=Alteromonas sp. a30 TaxID=2730917 RepID=UPI00227F7A26|nr:alkaline phosphatase family protein [Alteromonas sp. a30]MCY7294474.1 alkaline phosphatase family protein [Alteromonas sp. a30]
MKKFLAILSLCVLSKAALAEQPKLIVQLTIDQLRGDLLHRYKQHFVNQRNRKGFNRFLEQGITYDNTHYRHAATLTAVGHATLATGTLPAHHGIVANHWYDPITEQGMYCVADDKAKMLGDAGSGASPANLNASTFSDQLYMGSNGKAKVYAVSIKDRGAVLTGGHFGKAFWYNKSTGNFVTSNYYYDALPEWAQEFNESGLKDSYIGKQWRLSLNEDDYHNDAQNRIFQIPPKGFNRGFPHNMPKLTNDLYYRMIASTPFGDEMTINFAKSIIENEKLGNDNITDYLSMSFSVNDYIGHTYGPNSIEAEDGLIKLDSLLAEFFYYLDKRIGLDNVLLVIAADHGVDAIPEYKKARGFSGLRGEVDKAVDTVNKALMQKYGSESSFIKSAELPNIYFDHAALEKADVDADDFAEDFIKEVIKDPAVDRAYTKEVLKKPGFRDDVSQRVYNNFVPTRSGDIVLVQAPSAIMKSYSAATHGSPYKYDTHVPMYFAGWKLKPQRITRLTSPEDIAVTLSSVMKVGYPDKATGTVLPEVANSH